MTLAEAREGVLVAPRKASRFNIVVAGAVLQRIRDKGMNYWRAVDDLGFSTATAARWRKWGLAGEDPYASFIKLVTAAEHQRVKDRLGMTTRQAKAVVASIEDVGSGNNESEQLRESQQ